ncbi:MAG: chromosomal replication initiator protein DnaA [Acidobacteria bacterium]|nr:MAG: chromosomal replication initiator protein DnaA [Acidobacteriota bacterium]PYY02014.1 MAG: chromosomal replication initiator protein DnaA [Acidobacteriota bacterium]PYY24562.1 MAG: chromosomal replication initiator protein DnaA [Acidobacteriota bacterium]
MSLSSSAAAQVNPWMRILGALEKKINRHSYETWLKPTRFSHAVGKVMFVRVPTPEFRHIGDKYGDLIFEAVDNLKLEFEDFQFVTVDEDPSVVAQRPPSQPIPVQSAGHVGNGAAAVRSGVGASQSRFDWETAAQLNPKYTFEAFVIGSGNQFAHAASRAVAERPSKAYNPLFLYGGVGMGKTHLMQAIGHEVKKRMPEASICYVSSEKFTNEMINSLRYDKMTSFRDKFRNVDLLLIDDIQFLAQKERTQEEFFHTFNALHESMKQIVIASDRPPKELPEIEDRLRSRFEWGLIADIQPPDLETKVAILQKKSETERVPLPTDLALYIASNVRTNVRELEGALIRLIAYCSLTGAEVTLSTAQQVLKNFIDSQARKISIDSIQKAVAEQFGLRTPEIKQKNNSRSIVVPRQIAMYLAKQMTEASLPEIGRQFGGKHHTTVMHSIAKIDEQRRNDKDLNRLINKLTETLNG